MVRPGNRGERVALTPGPQVIRRRFRAAPALVLAVLLLAPGCSAPSRQDDWPESVYREISEAQTQGMGAVETLDQAKARAAEQYGLTREELEVVLWREDLKSRQRFQDYFNELQAKSDDLRSELKLHCDLQTLDSDPEAKRVIVVLRMPRDGTRHTQRRWIDSDAGSLMAYVFRGGEAESMIITAVSGSATVFKVSAGRAQFLRLIKERAGDPGAFQELGPQYGYGYKNYWE